MNLFERKAWAWTGVLAGMLAGPATAQVVRDGSIGPGVQVQPSGPDYQIDQSLGELRGTNLFHSFSRFDIGAAESVEFSAFSPVDHVVARVTGGSASRIDGRLGSSIAGADLYLLNPFGLLLGPGAQITLDGSLFLGSADYLGFDDQQRFAGDGTTTVLSTAAPRAFGFLQVPAPIAIDRADIRLPAGHGLVLAGGDLTLRGEAGATLIGIESGSVDLFSLGGAGEVVVAGEPATAGVSAYGQIELSLVEPADDAAEAAGDDDSEPPPVAQIDVSGDPAGRVTVVANDLGAADFVITADSRGALDADAGGIRVRASGDVVLTGESRFASSSQAGGRGGLVSIEADRIELFDDAELLSDALAEGAGGAVRLVADDLRLDGDAEIATDAEGSGAGGNVRIEVRTLTLTGNAEISSDTDPDSTAEGGSVTLIASERVEISIQGEEPAGVFTNTEGAGRAGDLSIRTPRLSMFGGVVTAETSATGAGGNVNIEAATVALSGSAAISALSSADSVGAGDAGNVSIEGVDSLNLSGGSRITTRSAFSDGGNIAIVGNGLVRVRDSRLSANVGDGVGGNLDIRTDTVVLHGSEVVAQAGAGQGGNITIGARRLFQSQTLISASSETGISGTVTIDAPEIDLSDSLAALPAEFLDAASLLQASCAARQQPRSSSFVVATRRGLPAGPDGLPLEREGLSVEGAAGLFNTGTRAALARLGQAEDALDRGETKPARAHLSAAESMLAALPASAARVHAWLNWHQVVLRLAATDPTDRPALLLRAHERLLEADAQARAVGSGRALSYVLGNLGALYAAEHRYDEALLLTRRALLAADRADAPESLYRWHWQRGRLLWAVGQADAAVQAYRAAVNILERIRQEAFVNNRLNPGFFDRSIAPVYLDLVDALLSGSDRVGDGALRTGLLREARATIERFRAAELRDYFRDPCVAALQARSASLDQLAANAAIVYPIILPQRLDLLVTLPGGLQRFTVPVEANRLMREAHRFRLALQQPSSQRYRGSARRLYDWLVRPYAAALAGSGVRTLVVVPDGPLRGIPMAALMDGDRYLVQDYALAVAPGLELVDPRPLRRDGLPVLLAGVSEAVQGFAALPGVTTELQAIRTRLGGRLMLDEGFRLAEFRAALREGEPGLVHIASHAQFGGSPDDSFVLTYDGRLRMDTLADYVGMTRFRRQPLELLVLSACQTAVGDDRAALGLAGVAVRAGARSALGSLWSIADEAAAELVQRFYAELGRDGVSRAEALRAAQLDLLERPPLAHPFFWSPFLLISNWL